MKKIVFYHAGCRVCLSALNDITAILGADNVEVIYLDEDKFKIADAQKAGVKSVPALVTPNGNVLHLNFGAFIEDIKK